MHKIQKLESEVSLTSAVLLRRTKDKERIRFRVAFSAMKQLQDSDGIKTHPAGKNPDFFLGWFV